MGAGGYTKTTIMKENCKINSRRRPKEETARFEFR